MNKTFKNFKEMENLLPERISGKYYLVSNKEFEFYRDEMLQRDCLFQNPFINMKGKNGNILFFRGYELKISHES